MPPPLMKGRLGRMQAPWGRGSSPNPLTQWEGGKTGAQAELYTGGRARELGEGGEVLP